MGTALERLTIGAFAAAADVNVETVRCYQRKGLFTEGARKAAETHGSRRWSCGQGSSLSNMLRREAEHCTLDQAGAACRVG